MDLGLTFMFELSLIWKKMLMLELGLPYFAMVHLSLIAIFCLFGNVVKRSTHLTAMLEICLPKVMQLSQSLTDLCAI